MYRSDITRDTWNDSVKGRTIAIRVSMEIYQVGLFYPREILIRVILIKQILTSSMVVYYDKGKGGKYAIYVRGRYA